MMAKRAANSPLVQWYDVLVLSKANYLIYLYIYRHPILELCKGKGVIITSEGALVLLEVIYDRGMVVR